MIAAAVLLLQAAPPAAPAPTLCRWEERSGDATTVHFGPARRCGTWSTRRRHVGVWIYGFEFSQFVEGASTVDEVRRVDGRTSDAWVQFDGESRFPGRCIPVMGRAYAIDFSGRDAPVVVRPPGPRGFLTGYGHFGGWSRQVLIDRVRTIRFLGPFGGDMIRPPNPCGGAAAAFLSSDSRR